MEERLLRLLVVEDREADFMLIERFLRKELPPFSFRRVENSEDLRAALDDGEWDVVLSDYSVPGMDFTATLEAIRARLPHVPVVLVSGSVGEEQAVSLVRQGIWDFVLKDNLVRLSSAIRRGMQEAEEHRARAEAEAALLDAESALRTLVNAIPESAILTDVDGIVLAANETIARRYGTIPQRMIGRRMEEFLPPDVAVERGAHIAESIRTGMALRFEDERFGRFIDNYVYPIKDERGQVKRLAVLGVDITERKQAEEKLREQATLLDVASDAIVLKDLDNRIVYWNKGAERIYGWMASETIGKNTAELLYRPADSSQAFEARAQTLANGEWHGDLRQLTKLGKDLIVEGRWTVMRDAGGAPRGVLSVNSDVTTQRAIQSQLLRSQRLESLGTLAGGIAHDLNNVLQPILMGVESLSFRDPDVSARKILGIIKTSAERGANIVRQILNFARGVEGNRGEIQVKHIMREIEGIIRETFSRSIALRTTISRDLWPIVGDATQLHQVLMNLCVNARDAMPNGGEITLTADNVILDKSYAQMNIDARPIRYVLLKVDDTGTGIAEGVLEKIFDPFFTTKEPGKGSGLGLSTVRSIVQSHGGFINVYSETGKGSSFRVYIPASDQKASPASETPPEGIPMGDGELILVVEDEISLRDITCQTLESCGYRVVTALDGTEALVRFLEHRVELKLVITDMMMPFMDGAATIRAIRKIDPDARIIATSGLMAQEYAREASSLGVQAFLAKPYTAETLLNAIRDAIGTDGKREPGKQEA